MRILKSVGATILAGILAFAMYVLWWNQHRHETARRAQAVFLKVRGFRLRRTEGSEVAAMAAQNEATSNGSCAANCEVTIRISDYPVRFNGKIFRLLGIRPSTNRFDFVVRNGKLTSFHFAQGTLELDGTTYLFVINQDFDDFLRLNYSGRETATHVLPRSSLILERIYSPAISDDEWVRVLSFNFDCTSRWRPCTKLRDYMPEAWAEYEQLQRAKGGNVFE
jgi:hypothetical protein